MNMGQFMAMRYYLIAIFGGIRMIFSLLQLWSLEGVILMDPSGKSL